MIHADENKIILMIILLFELVIFSTYFKEKFSVKFFYVFLKHILRTHKATKTLQMDSMEVKH